MKIKNIIQKYLHLALIFGVLVLLFWANYTPGTWLIGWDNLLPEFNIWLNLKRSLNAVWQEYQGLGLVGGMGHATDLVRQIILLPLVLLLPNHLIRYFWHFAMLALGTLGILQFRKKIFILRKWPATLGALFYLLNFGTIQYFWPPYEPFSTFWGFFPWLIFAFWQMMEYPSKKNLSFLILVNFLAIPSFYVPTLFIVYLLCLAAAGFAYLVYEKKFSLILKVGLLIILVNLFWLLPFGYYFVTNVNNSRLSITNFMTSEETFLRNQKRGTLADFLLLRGYYYDFPDGEKPLMLSWTDHFSQALVLKIGYFLGALTLVGLLVLIFNWKKNKKEYRFWPMGLLGLWLLGAIALLSNTVPFSWLNYLLRQSPLFSQIFRAPFTKFIVPASFSFAILFAIAIQALAKSFQKINSKMTLILYLPLLILILFFSYPTFLTYWQGQFIFQGNFIYPKMRVKIPEEYFQLIDFFKQQPKSARIANLPQGGFWGWTFYRWGMRGSGFLWYGIEQPILDRNFDVWNLKNEQYYWELNLALLKQDIKMLEKVLEKYQVQYVLFDDSVFFTGEKIYAKLALKTKHLLTQSQRLKKAASFGQIDVYRFDQETQPQLFTGQLISAYPLHFHQKDPIYEKHGHYLVDKKGASLFYPFGELFTNRNQNEIQFEISETDQAWIISRKLPEFINENYQLKIDSSLAPKTIPVNPKLLLPEKRSQEEISLKPKDFVNPHHCAPQKKDALIEFKNDQGFLDLKAKDAALCVSWGKYDFFKKYKLPMVITIEFEYQSKVDEWPQYCLWDDKSKQCLNRKELPLKGFARQWDQFSETIFFDPQKNEIAGLTFILDAYLQKEEKEIKYRQIKIKIDRFKTAPTSMEIEHLYQITQKKDQLLVKIPKVDSTLFIDNPIVNNLFKLKPKTCNPYLTGDYDLQFEQEDNQKFIRLSAQYADSCLSWYYPKLPLSPGWLVEIEYRFQNGYPLLVTGLDGLGRYKFFYTKLEKTQNWQKAYLVIPPTSEIEKGIVVALGNTSFSQLPSINDIASLKMIPLAWDYLKSIYFEKETEEQTPIISPLKSKGLSWLYYLSLPEKTEHKTNYLYLPQSYDLGWQAFAIINNQPKLLKHVVIDNWANGWVIPKVISQKTLLIFVPQLLEYLGFLLLLIPVCIFFRKIKKKEKAPLS